MSPKAHRPNETEAEPGIGSVVMLHGIEGTAWQRLRSDGLWHSVNGEVAEWRDLLASLAGKRLPIVILSIRTKRSGADAI